MHRGSPYLSAGFKNNIHRKTHACNQTDFLHQNNCKGERHRQSPCNHICQVSNEELKLQSFGCQRPLTGGQIYLCWHTIHQEQHIVTLVLYLIHSKVLAFLALQFFSFSICVFPYVMHTCRPVFLWWPLWDRDQQASDPFTGKLFSFFSHSPWAARRLFLYHSLFLFTSSSLLPVFTW